jgi:hypothetical protein
LKDDATNGRRGTPLDEYTCAFIALGGGGGHFKERLFIPAKGNCNWKEFWRMLLPIMTSYSSTGSHATSNTIRKEREGHTYKFDAAPFGSMTSYTLK